MLKRFLLAAVFLAPIFFLTSCATITKSSKDPCKGASTTYALNLCKGEIMKTLDAKMLKLIENITMYSKKGDFGFNVTQIAWENYRKAQCEYEASFYEGGTVKSIIYADCYIRTTEQRIEELQGVIQELCRDELASTKSLNN